MVQLPCEAGPWWILGKPAENIPLETCHTHQDFSPRVTGHFQSSSLQRDRARRKPGIFLED
jgi:hypothetical protein